MFLTVSLSLREAELIMTPRPILIKSFHIVDFTQQRKNNIYLISKLRVGDGGRGTDCECLTSRYQRCTVKLPLQDYDFTDDLSCPALNREQLVIPLLWRQAGGSAGQSRAEWSGDQCSLDFINRKFVALLKYTELSNCSAQLWVPSWSS